MTSENKPKKSIRFDIGDEKSISIDIDRMREHSMSNSNAPTSALDDTDIFHVPFHTHAAIKWPASSKMLPYNNRFVLRFYLPKKVKPTKIFIMINGFAEGRSQFWDHFGCSLAKAGFAAVLFPLPMHFCRHPLFNINEFNIEDPYILEGGKDRLKLYTQSLVNGLVQNPELAIYYDSQMMADIDFLVQGFQSGGGFTMKSLHDLFESRMQGPLQCSIMGFSLGGLCALQAFLMNPKNFNACILVNSGANFQDMNGSAVFKDKWETLQLGLLEKTRELKRLIPDHFERVFLGHEKLEMHRDLEENRDKILLVLGGSDPIINRKNIFNLEPDKGLALFQIPALPHFINTNKLEAMKRWRDYSEMVIRLAIAFDDFRPKLDKSRSQNLNKN